MERKISLRKTVSDPRTKIRKKMKRKCRKQGTEVVPSRQDLGKGSAPFPCEADVGRAIDKTADQHQQHRAHDEDRTTSIWERGRSVSETRNGVYSVPITERKSSVSLFLVFVLRLGADRPHSRTRTEPNLARAKPLRYSRTNGAVLGVFERKFRCFNDWLHSKK